MMGENIGMEELENEIKAMRRIVNALETLPEDRRFPVLDYVRRQMETTTPFKQETGKDA